MSKGWDNAMLKKLRALTGKGLSTAEIGKKLGVSKNAVVGKLDRLRKAGGVPSENTADNKKKPSAATATKTAKASKTSKTVTKSSGAAKTPAKSVAKKASGRTPAPAKKTTTAKTVKTAAPKKPAVQKKASVATKPAPKKEPKAAPAATKTRPATTDKRSASKNLAMHQRIIQHSLEMANLKPNQCRWPIGDPDSENFHFCGDQVFVGKPYCYEHCRMAYQFTPPKKK